MTGANSRGHRVIEEDLEWIVSERLPWNLLAEKTVLISGAAGFLASYMVETLLYLNEAANLGCRVIGLARNPEKAVRRFALHSHRSDLRLIIRDVCDPLAVDGPVHFLIHAASQASPKYYGTDPVGTLSANVMGSHRMLALAREKHAEAYLFISSAEVYGQVDSGSEGIRETEFGSVDPARVRSCYAESKRMGETMAVCWHTQYGIDTKIVRPFHTYGPGMDPDDGRVQADFVADIAVGRDLLLHSDGKGRRAFCYVADATAGFFTVLLKGTSAEAYNVGNDRAEVSILELAQLLAALYPEKHIQVKFTPQDWPAGYLQTAIGRLKPNIEKIRALGWQPRTTLEQGFRRTLASLS